MRIMADRLDELLDIIISDKFQAATGIGNELNFHIFDYNPKYELEVREFTNKLIGKVKRRQPEMDLIIFDLYEIILSFFIQKGYMEKNLKIEEISGSDNLFNKIRQPLKLATDQDYIVSYIEQRITKETTVILTGVGKAYPIIRSHVLLQNLQLIMKSKPLILFYPGSYINTSLSLFDIFQDDNYYRAFRMVER
ncbi:DUF1788 domain-containing protein [Listeria ivanovii]|uniref:DUF1788 domain-containing protein n=1 Tax=Listeria ivanovii TaxID=1638 RepID=UPI000DA7E9DA|nr:DUF1788 domain-containing protein [Listeria ivanovii]PZF87826.1 DUF1788 domain-containing protein [Listeria ivanovii]PZF92987.1 DUF1788 domain-containing protein [Listeria ivanovii]PZG03898.1 DUF1788 domain-containing protein [Listeria ivanovii]PZG08296.1 DUF1788 domain-containing protein [Listeria ivanovii]PZG25138.1 DUF1788 domain-containing protein [Listeria ivanovii]